MQDQHFTPDWVADLMIGSIRLSPNTVLLDPAAGEGALLNAAERCSPESHFIAIDKDPNVVGSLRLQHPDWIVSRADSLNLRSIKSSAAWKSVYSRGVDWVLMNPPFSYRGGPSRIVEFGSFEGRLSPAAEFLATAITQIAPRQGVVAILPLGLLTGEKHELFWQAVRKDYSVEPIADLQKTTFDGVSASSQVVKLQPLRKGPHVFQQTYFERQSVVTSRSGCVCLQIIRGRFPKHTQLQYRAGNTPYVHTTDLSENTFNPSGSFAPAHLASFGPALLLPRVGRPLGKIAIMKHQTAVLSDCLIALRPMASQLNVLQQELLDDLTTFEKIYSGTGAQYTTVRKVEEYLLFRGWNPTQATADAPAPVCECR